MEYVHEHLAEELSLIDLAEPMNLSAFHFARLFKNSLGLSPHQYVLQNTVARAKKLITVFTKPNLTDVGLQVGFYDQAHFTKAFTISLSSSRYTGDTLRYILVSTAVFLGVFLCL